MSYAKVDLDSAAFRLLLPDSANFWFEHPSQRHRPLVSITYDQAMAYCAWRSKVVSELMKKQVTYRLPTEKEWSEIAEELLKTNEADIRKEVARSRRLVKKHPGDYVLLERETIRERVYHFFDNVSEMVLERGIAKGANNLDLSAEPSRSITRQIKYNGPNPYLGFRCIAEVAD